MDAEQSEGFSRRYRLTAAADFRRVFSRPLKVGDADLTLLARANHREHARLGLAIAKKQLPRAVDRNRIKRLARESFRRHKGDLAGLDIVVLARRSIAARDSTQVHAQFEALWRKLAARHARQAAPTSEAIPGSTAGSTSAKSCKD